MSTRTILASAKRLYEWLLIVMVTAMFLVVSVNVFSRYVLNSSLGWADELARFLFIYVALLGAVVAYQDDEHVALDMVVSSIKSRPVKHAIRVVAQILVVFSLGIFTYYSGEAAFSAQNVSPALYIPMTVVYGVMPVSGALMLALSVFKLFAVVAGRDPLKTGAAEGR